METKADKEEAINWILLTVEDLPGITASIRSSQSQWEFQEECQHFKAHKESSIPNLKNGVLLS